MTQEIVRFYLLGNYVLINKTLRGMRTRLIGRTLGAASLPADSLFLLWRKSSELYFKILPSGVIVITCQGIIF